jgi:drug/metabolite transporter (DMT)-like permease
LQPITAEAVAAILYQGAVVAGVCFIIWTTLLTKVSPGLLSMFAFATPIFGVVLSGWYLGEPITPRLWLGLAAVTAGILIVTLARPRVADKAVSTAWREVMR